MPNLDKFDDRSLLEPPEPPQRWLCPNSECKEWLGVGDKLYCNGKGKVIGCSCCIKSMDAEDYEW